MKNEEDFYPYIEAKITDEQYKQVVEFAKKSYRGRKGEYLTRKGLQPNLPDNNPHCIKLFRDIVHGTGAEFIPGIIFSEIKNKNFRLINAPDLNTYDASQKSYASDLKILHKNNERPFHIKNRPPNTNGLTWLCTKRHVRPNGKINYGDKLVDPSLTQNNKDLIGFFKQMDGKTYRFYGMINREILIQYKKEPYNQNQKATKVAFYFKDFADQVFLPKK